MNISIVVPPTKAILAACDAIDDAIVNFLSARGSLKGYETYSSSAEALMLVNLVIRQIEGVLLVARHDLVMLPAAMACARAALETAAKAAWMVDSNDPFHRETRWLAHIEEGARVYDRAAKRFAEVGLEQTSFTERAFQARTFRKAVEAKLPPGVVPLKHIPTADEMLTMLHGKHLYPLYIFMSQFVHGGHLATGFYRGGVGTELRPGEYIESSSWYVPLRVCWLSLKEPVNLVLWRLGMRRKSYLAQSTISKANAAIERINVVEH